MRDLRPVIVNWDGEKLAPTPESLPLCMRQFEKGELYQLSAERQRSVASHREFMALVNEAFHNLPERYADRFPTVDRLRYWCLVKCNYCHEQTIVCDTVREAERWGNFLMQLQEDAIVQWTGGVIKMWTPKSQRYKHNPEMSYEEFEQAKEAVLELLAEMIGVHPRDLRKNAGMAYGATQRAT